MQILVYFRCVEYLEYTSAATIIYAPVAYLSIPITRTDEVIFIRVEIQRHHRCRMTHKVTQRKSRLQANSKSKQQIIRDGSLASLSRRWNISSRNFSQLTLSASQTRTVLSKDDVARRGSILGLKRTSVIIDECSSRVVFGFKESVYHSTACIIKFTLVITI